MLKAAQASDKLRSSASSPAEVREGHSVLSHVLHHKKRQWMQVSSVSSLALVSPSLVRARSSVLEEALGSAAGVQQGNRERMRHVPFGMYRVACAVWHVPCGMCRAAWHVPFGMYRVACAMWHVPCGMCRVACAVWHVPCGMTARRADGMARGIRDDK
jgi:hypothetical protein